MTKDISKLTDEEFLLRTDGMWPHATQAELRQRLERSRARFTAVSEELADAVEAKQYSDKMHLKCGEELEESQRRVELLEKELRKARDHLNKYEGPGQKDYYKFDVGDLAALLRKPFRVEGSLADAVALRLLEQQGQLKTSRQRVKELEETLDSRIKSLEEELAVLREEPEAQTLEERLDEQLEAGPPVEEVPSERPHIGMLTDELVRRMREQAIKASDYTLGIYREAGLRLLSYQWEVLELVKRREQQEMELVKLRAELRDSQTLSRGKVNYHIETKELATLLRNSHIPLCIVAARRLMDQEARVDILEKHKTSREVELDKVQAEIKKALILSEERRKEYLVQKDLANTLQHEVQGAHRLLDKANINRGSLPHRFEAVLGHLGYARGRLDDDTTAHQKLVDSWHATLDDLDVPKDSGALPDRLRLLKDKHTKMRGLGLAVEDLTKWRNWAKDLCKKTQNHTSDDGSLRTHIAGQVYTNASRRAQMEELEKEVKELKQQVEDLGVRLSDAEGHAPDGMTLEKALARIADRDAALGEWFTWASNETRTTNKTAGWLRYELTRLLLTSSNKRKAMQDRVISITDDMLEAVREWNRRIQEVTDE